MALYAPPIPTEIIPWMQGFASIYLASHAVMGEEMRDHAGSALVDFQVRVMAPSRTGGSFPGSDRFRIAKEIAAAGPDRVTEWERELETIDALWKKSLCTHLSHIVSRMRVGAVVFTANEEPVWVEDLLARGLAGVFTPEPVPSGVTKTQILFLEKSLQDALAKGDVRRVSDVIDRIDTLDPPGAAAFLRQTAEQLLTERRIAKEGTHPRRTAVSEAGRKALLVLARRSDFSVLSVLENLTKGDAVLFGETTYGGRFLEPDSAVVFQTLAMALVAGDFGLEGQHLLETYLRDLNFVLPQPETLRLRKDAAVGEWALRATFKHRSGVLLLRLLAKNSGLDPLLLRNEFRRLPLYFTPFHLNLLEPIARQRRGETLQWILGHEDLIAAIRRSSEVGRERAVQSLISVYHQAENLSEREAVADLIEVTHHPAAVAFFQSEVARLAHVLTVRDVRDLVGRLLFGETSAQARFQRRIARIRDGDRSRSG